MKKVIKALSAGLLAAALFSCSNSTEIKRSTEPAKAWTLYLPGKGSKKDVVKDVNKAGWQVSNTVREHFSLVDSNLNGGKVLKLNTLDGKQDSLILPLSGSEKKVTVIFKAIGAVDPDNKSTPYGIFFSFLMNGKYQSMLRHNASNQIKGSKGSTRLKPDDIVSDWHDFRFVYDIPNGPESMTAECYIDGKLRHKDIRKEVGGIETDINWDTMTGMGNYLHFGESDGSTNGFGRYAYILVVLDEDVSGMSLEELGKKVGADLATNPVIKDSTPPSRRPASKPAGINIQGPEIGKGVDFLDPSHIEGTSLDLDHLPVSRAKARTIVRDPSEVNMTFAAVVDKSGENGAYKTIAAAIEAVPSNSAIKIMPGFYNEKLVIKKPGISLVGTNPANTVIYGYEADTGGIDGNILVDVNYLPANTVTTPGVKAPIPEAPVENCYFNAVNLTFYNRGGEWNELWGSSERRSITLGLKGVDKCYLKNCIFLGLQDTIYWRSGRVYAEDCFIQGTVDYMCGGATAYLKNCQIHSVEYSNGGIITAAAGADTGYNSTKEFANGFVFVDSMFTGAKSFEFNPKKVTLARGTWVGGSATGDTEIGKNVLINCEMKPIFEEKYRDWDNVNTAAKCFFREYKCTGEGASPDRPQLTAAEASKYSSAEKVLGFVPALN